MREFPDTLTPDQVYRFAVDFCQPRVDFHPAGKITATTLVTVSFAAAARNSSISETCRRHDTSSVEKSVTPWADLVTSLDLSAGTHYVNKFKYYDLKITLVGQRGCDYTRNVGISASVPVQVRPRENPDG